METSSWTVDRSTFHLKGNCNSYKNVCIDPVYTKLNIAPQNDKGI